MAYFVMVFSNTKLWSQLDDQYYANVLVAIFQFATAVLFIWKKMPGEKKLKSNSTFLIVILGIIGMWLWLPNKEELGKLEEAETRNID
ncbi:MAG: hypothetical protein HRT57_12630 [Crocinitomicaceae bacterium]|nr:hypothetical protein [Crocinitomicaceae bacterium]